MSVCYCFVRVGCSVGIGEFVMWLGQIPFLSLLFLYDKFSLPKKNKKEYSMCIG